MLQAARVADLEREEPGHEQERPRPERSRDRELQEQWTQRGLDEGDPYWAGPLYNNLGVAYSEAGDHARALELFELALEARLRDPDNEQAIEWAREAVEEEKQFLAEA